MPVLGTRERRGFLTVVEDRCCESDTACCNDEDTGEVHVGLIPRLAGSTRSSNESEVYKKQGKDEMKIHVRTEKLELRREGKTEITTGIYRDHHLPTRRMQL